MPLLTPHKREEDTAATPVAPGQGLRPPIYSPSCSPSSSPSYSSMQSRRTCFIAVSPRQRLFFVSLKRPLHRFSPTTAAVVPGNKDTTCFPLSL